jgi:hypothetical protein
LFLVCFRCLMPNGEKLDGWMNLDLFMYYLIFMACKTIIRAWDYVCVLLVCLWTWFMHLKLFVIVWFFYDDWMFKMTGGHVYVLSSQL